MTILLAIDTATEACSAALSIDGEVIEHFGLMPRMHSQKILPMIEQVLAKAGISKTAIDAIAFGRGPGAFTGVRIATAITQGLAFALDKPVIPVSSLAALAQLALRTQKASHILTAIDARMNEVYWATFTTDSTKQRVILQSQETVIPPELAQPALTNPTIRWTGIGSGWAFKERIPAQVASYQVEAFPHAQDIAELALPLYEEGQAVSPELTMPVYLRNDVAKKSKKKVKPSPL